MTALALVPFVVLDEAMHTLHVVTKIPLPGESIGGLGPFAGRELAKKRVVSMVVHAVSFALVSKEAGVRGEAELLAVLLDLGIPACVRPEMGVQIFTVGALWLAEVPGSGISEWQPTRKCTFAWLACACSRSRSAWDSGRSHPCQASCRREDQIAAWSSPEGRPCWMG